MEQSGEPPNRSTSEGVEDLDLLSVLETMGHAVVVAANRDDHPVVYVNAAFEAISGLAREDIVGRNCRILRGAAPSGAPQSHFRRALAEEVEATVLVLNERPDGEQYWNEVVLRPLRAAGRVTHFVGVQSDVTERVAAQELVRKLADRDPLTGLSNRRHLDRRLEAEDAVAGGVAGLLFVDVDRFKQTNDHLGHEAGDELLVELARRLAEVTRPSDLLARVGGDEFVVVLARAGDVRGVALAAERILEGVRRPFRLSNSTEEVTLSIGAATGPMTGRELLSAADAAMYRVKRAGGDGWLPAITAPDER